MRLPGESKLLSIKDGDNRRDGLQQVLAQGGELNMVVRSTKWPGRGNVIVSLVAIHNGTWKGKHSLDGGDVSTINAFFEDSASGGDPLPLFANAAKLFQGSIFLGDGFLLSHEEAARLIAADSRNRAENDRVRYTISPAARKEVLRRLLALNHARAEEEATKAPGKTAKRQRKPRNIDAGGGLFT